MPAMRFLIDAQLPELAKPLRARESLLEVF
jgi:hypothetical protein